MIKAEVLLANKDALEDPEEKAKEEIAAVKRKARREIAVLESDLKNLVEGLELAVQETSIWLKDNHTALLESVKTAQDDLSRKHPEYGERILALLEIGEAKTEETRQNTFRDQFGPKLGTMKAKLLSKTPAGVALGGGRAVHPLGGHAQV